MKDERGIHLHYFKIIVFFASLLDCVIFCSFRFYPHDPIGNVNWPPYRDSEGNISTVSPNAQPKKLFAVVIYIINPVDEIKLSCYTTTVAIEAYPIIHVTYLIPKWHIVRNRNIKVVSICFSRCIELVLHSF